MSYNNSADFKKKKKKAPSFKNTIVINRRVNYYSVYAQNRFIRIVFLTEGASFFFCVCVKLIFVIMLTDTIPDMARSGFSMRYFHPRYRLKDRQFPFRVRRMPSVRPPRASSANTLETELYIICLGSFIDYRPYRCKTPLSSQKVRSCLSSSNSA